MMILRMRTWEKNATILYAVAGFVTNPRILYSTTHCSGVSSSQSPFYGIIKRLLLLLLLLLLLEDDLLWNNFCLLLESCFPNTPTYYSYTTTTTHTWSYSSSSEKQRECKVTNKVLLYGATTSSLIKSVTDTHYSKTPQMSS